MQKPFLPATDVSGKSRNINWLCYRNAVIEGLRDLGASCAEGLGVWAERSRSKIQIRYELGLTPEDAAKDIFEAWPKPCKYDNGMGAIRDAIQRAKETGNWNKPL